MWPWVGGGTSLYGVVPVAGSPSPLMYYGDYQFDWLCSYTVVLLGTSITGYNRLVCTIIVYWCTCDAYNLALKYALYQPYICIRFPYSYIKQAAATLEIRPASLYASDTTGNINVIFSTVKKWFMFLWWRVGISMYY